MNKKLNPNQPHLVKVTDKHGDELTPRFALKELRADRKNRDSDCFASKTTVREDLQAVRRRPLDAPMATWKSNDQLNDVVEPAGIGRMVLTLLLITAGFIAGVAVGRIW